MDNIRFSEYNDISADEIAQLVTETFSDSEGQGEGRLIGGLAMDLMTSTPADELYGFIAAENGALIGIIFFTRMKFQTGINAFILAPVAIRTDHQRRGVGQRLIRHGLNTLYKDGVELIVTYGDPNFYSRVGFRTVTAEEVPPPMPLSMPHGWQAQSTTGDEIEPIAGKSCCVAALNRPEYW